MSSSVLVLDRAWFNVPLPVKRCSLKELATNLPSKEDLDNYFQEAQTCLDEEVEHMKHDRGRWYMQQFQSRGTVSDKVASAAVKLCEYDFMFFMDSFNLLFETARADSHHYDAALKALGVIWPKLLPPRPLKRFNSQHFATLPSEGPDRKKVLMYWYLEDHLKRTYGQFLSLCEGMLKDKQLHRREAWLELAGKLLLSIAESRNIMIAMIVEKLGDPMAVVGHKAYHHLLALLSESSTNQAALLTELEKLAFTKNCPLRAMRFCVNVMAQLVFNKEERKLALKCVQTYLSLFRELIMTGRIEQSVTSAIITGIRRAFPYAGTDYSPLGEHLDALFVLANTATFSQRISTLSLLQHLINKGTPPTFINRWYRALYQSLLVSPKQLPHASQLSGLFSMLHKALRTDTNSDRVAAFVHRLLQRSLFFSEAFICAVLLLVGELIQANPGVRALLRRKPAATTTSKSSEETPAAYNPRHRDPQYSGAVNSLLFTLNFLTKHSHPSVVKLAVLILFGEELAFDSHPLDDLSLGNFLQMFVDAKTKNHDDHDSRASGKENKGVSVFRRSVHAPTIPSSSDAYFVSAAPETIDVSAVFLHRYAVQRKRFIDGLSHVKSTWGDTCGEQEVPDKLTSSEPLFGPDGGIARKKKEKKAAVEEAEAKSSDEAEEAPAPKTKSKKSKEVVDEDEVDDDSDADDFDVDPDEADLSWGSEDDAAYEEFSGEDDDSDAEYNEDEDGGALSSRRKRAVAGDVDTEEFENLIDQQRAAGTSKKRQREEEWLERASGAANVRGGRGGFRGNDSRGRGRFRQ